jgi:toxin-antitoxin system PIN domain toxin
VIVIDTSLLLYAYNAASAHHRSAREWLEATFSGREHVGLPWTVIFGFIRISTNSRAHAEPFTLEEITATVSDWLARKNIVALSPGPRHWEIVTDLLIGGQARGPMAMDAHIAAHAIEHGATLATNDRDSRDSKACASAIR